MGSKEYFTWQVVENTVTERLENSSLSHLLTDKTKVCKRTKLVNEQLKRYKTIRTYKRYVKCKMSIIRKCKDNESVVESSDYDDKDYEKFYASVGCHGSKYDDCFHWICVEKDKPKEWKDEDLLIEPSAKSIEVPRSKTKVVNLENWLEKRPDSKLAEVLSNSVVDDNDNPVSSDESNPSSGQNVNAVQKKESVKKSPKDIKRNLTSAIDNATPKTSTEEDEWNDEFVPNEFQAQSTQIFSDTIPGNRRSISKKLLLAHNELNQPKDSGIDEDAIEDNAKCKGIANINKVVKSSDSNKEENKHPLKIIGEEKLVKKYKIVKKGKQLQPIKEDEQVSETNSVKEKPSDHGDEKSESSNDDSNDEFVDSINAEVQQENSSGSYYDLYHDCNEIKSNDRDNDSHSSVNAKIESRRSDITSDKDSDSDSSTDSKIKKSNTDKEQAIQENLTDEQTVNEDNKEPSENSQTSQVNEKRSVSNERSSRGDRDDSSSSHEQSQEMNTQLDSVNCEQSREKKKRKSKKKREPRKYESTSDESDTEKSKSTVKNSPKRKKNKTKDESGEKKASDVNSDVDIEDHKVELPDDCKGIDLIQSLEKNCLDHDKSIQNGSLAQISKRSSTSSREMDAENSITKAEKPNKSKDAQTENNPASPKLAEQRQEIEPDVKSDSDDEEFIQKDPIKQVEKIVAEPKVDESDEDESDSKDNDRPLSPSAALKLSQFKKLNLLDNNSSSSDDEAAKKKGKESSSDSDKSKKSDKKSGKSKSPEESTPPRSRSRSSDSDADKSEASKASNKSKISEKRVSPRKQSNSSDSDSDKSDVSRASNKSNNVMTQKPSNSNDSDSDESNVSKTSNKSKSKSPIKDATPTKSTSSKSPSKVTSNALEKAKRAQESGNKQGENLASQDLFSSSENLAKAADEDKLDPPESNNDLNVNSQEIPLNQEQLKPKRVTNISELVERDNLTELDFYNSSMSLNNISDNVEVFLIDVPKYVLDKNLKKQKFYFSKTTLQLGEDKYEAYKKHSSPTLTCLFKTGKNSTNSFKTYNIRPVASIVARRKKNRDNGNDSESEISKFGDEMDIESNESTTSKRRSGRTSVLEKLRLSREGESTSEETSRDSEIVTNKVTEKPEKSGEPDNEKVVPRVANDIYDDVSTQDWEKSRNANNGEMPIVIQHTYNKPKPVKNKFSVDNFTRKVSTKKKTANLPSENEQISKIKAQEENDTNEKNLAVSCSDSVKQEDSWRLNLAKKTLDKKVESAKIWLDDSNSNLVADDGCQEEKVEKNHATVAGSKTESDSDNNERPISPATSTKLSQYKKLNLSNNNSSSSSSEDEADKIKSRRNHSGSEKSDASKTENSKSKTKKIKPKSVLTQRQPSSSDSDSDGPGVSKITQKIEKTPNKKTVHNDSYVTSDDEKSETEKKVKKKISLSLKCNLDSEKIVNTQKTDENREVVDGIGKASEKKNASPKKLKTNLHTAKVDDDDSSDENNASLSMSPSASKKLTQYKKLDLLGGSSSSSEDDAVKSKRTSEGKEKIGKEKSRDTVEQSDVDAARVKKKKNKNKSSGEKSNNEKSKNTLEAVDEMYVEMNTRELEKTEKANADEVPIHIRNTDYKSKTSNKSRSVENKFTVENFEKKSRPKKKTIDSTAENERASKVENSSNTKPTIAQPSFGGSETIAKKESDRIAKEQEMVDKSNEDTAKLEKKKEKKKVKESDAIVHNKKKAKEVEEKQEVINELQKDEEKKKESPEVRVERDVDDDKSADDGEDSDRSISLSAAKKLTQFKKLNLLGGSSSSSEDEAVKRTNGKSRTPEKIKSKRKKAKLNFSNSDGSDLLVTMDRFDKTLNNVAAIAETLIDDCPSIESEKKKKKKKKKSKENDENGAVKEQEVTEVPIVEEKEVKKKKKKNKDKEENGDAKDQEVTEIPIVEEKEIKKKKKKKNKDKEENGDAKDQEVTEVPIIENQEVKKKKKKKNKDKEENGDAKEQEVIEVPIVEENEIKKKKKKKKNKSSSIDVDVDLATNVNDERTEESSREVVEVAAGKKKEKKKSSSLENNSNREKEKQKLDDQSSADHVKVEKLSGSDGSVRNLKRKSEVEIVPSVEKKKLKKAEEKTIDKPKATPKKPFGSKFAFDIEMNSKNTLATSTPKPDNPNVLMNPLSRIVQAKKPRKKIDKSTSSFDDSSNFQSAKPKKKRLMALDESSSSDEGDSKAFAKLKSESSDEKFSQQCSFETNDSRKKKKKKKKPRISVHFDE